MRGLAIAVATAGLLGPGVAGQALPETTEVEQLRAELLRLRAETTQREITLRHEVVRLTQQIIALDADLATCVLNGQFAALEAAVLKRTGTSRDAGVRFELETGTLARVPDDAADAEGPPEPAPARAVDSPPPGAR